MTEPILSIRDLSIAFPRRAAPSVTVVDSVGFDVMPGEIVGVVGESGSGKSMTARSVLRLLPKTAEVQGSIRFRGDEVLKMSPDRIREMRGALVSMVFQDPMTSFNPVLRIGDQIAEAIAIHGRTSRASLGERVAGLLARVGIPEPKARARAYPHEFSGGMRQRALTAMAVANGPALLIADEPTTALDVVVQKGVLAMIHEIQRELGSSILFVTHDMSVHANLADRLGIMYAGRLVEEGRTADVFRTPRHPYTAHLIASLPRLGDSAPKQGLEGAPPNLANPPAGCRFHPRCPRATDICRRETPPMAWLAEGHRAACFHPATDPTT
jgi:oligopeptide/dipeptide ABC transporter ATP-binding protein